MPTVQDVSARRRAFRPLHAAGCFVIPNPWEVGSTKFLESLGFKALATTSSGAAWRQGQADGQVPVEDVLAHLREMVGATGLPVNADFEGAAGGDTLLVGAPLGLTVQDIRPCVPSVIPAKAGIQRALDPRRSLPSAKAGGGDDSLSCVVARAQRGGATEMGVRLPAREAIGRRPGRSAPPRRARAAA